MFGYLLRLGIQVALLAIGGVLALGIYYSEGRILVDGWEWVQGMADAVTEFFVRCCYFLGIGALLVLLVYGSWRVGELSKERRRVCSQRSLRAHGSVSSWVGGGLYRVREDGERGGTLLEGSVAVWTRRGGLRLQISNVGEAPAFRGLADAPSSRPADAGDPYPEHGRRPLLASLRSALHDPHPPARPRIGRCDHHRRPDPPG